MLMSTHGETWERNWLEEEVGRSVSPHFHLSVTGARVHMGQQSVRLLPDLPSGIPIQGPGPTLLGSRLGRLQRKRGALFHIVDAPIKPRS